MGKQKECAWRKAMTPPRIEAMIVEELDGPHYPVCLDAIPRAGDMIHLESRLDAKSGHESHHYYIVTRIVHYVMDKIEEEHRVPAAHTVSVLVVPVEKALK